MAQKHDVIIVGAGIAGLGAAYYLKRAGRQVTIIERGAGRNNCSYGNAGMIVPSHFIPLASPGIISQGLRWMVKSESPFSIKPRLDWDLLKWGWTFRKSATEKHVRASGPVLKILLLKNRELLTDLEQSESLDFKYRKNGLLMLCRTQHGLDEEAGIAEKAKSLGIPAEVLSAEEIREKEPDIKMDVFGGVYFPKDAHLHPGMLMDQLKELLVKKGVRILYNHKVTGFQTDRSRVKRVMMDESTHLEPQQLVISAGAFSSELVRKTKHYLPMQAGKGYSITLNGRKKLPNICALLAEAKVSMTPMNGSLRFGGTMEITDKSAVITPAKIKALKKSVLEYFPGFLPEELDQPEVWSGLRPCSPDGLPYVGKLNALQNCFVSTGHAMMGMSLGLSSGQLLSQLMENRKAPLNHPMINPNRFM